MSRYDTLLLDRTAGDLVLDSAGNIALASPPYSLAQDVASAIRTILGEVYYDKKTGIPYRTQVLGQLPPANLLESYCNDAALTVPGVVEAKTVLTSFSERNMHGICYFIDEEGEGNNVSF